MIQNRKKIILKVLLCAVPLVFSACGNNSGTNNEAATSSREVATEAHNQDHAQHKMDSEKMGGMMGHMHENMKEMHSLELTGDPDYDFAKMMAKHHEGAIRMAEEELSNGKDEKLKQMAQKSMTTNREEIKKLEAFANKHKPTTGDTVSTMKMMQPMKKMMGTMDHQSMMAATTDQNFAQMMSHHHQSGVEMAREYLSQGKSAELKNMAQKTLSEQQKEKEELDSWLAQNK